MRTIPIVLGVLAIILVILTAFLFLSYPTTPSTKQPIVFSTNEILVYPTIARFGSSFSFAVWNSAVQNNSNETQRFVASLLSTGNPLDFQSVALNVSQHISLTACEGPARTGTDYTVSVIASSRTGSTNFTVPVTMRTATRVPFNGQVVVANNLVNSSESAKPGQSGSGQWNMTIENNGTKPIVFFYATLYDPGASSYIFTTSSCPYPAYFGGQSRAVSPQTPLTQDQLLAVSYPAFLPGVTAGKTYSIDFAVGYADGTEVVFTTTVQAN